MGTGRYCTYKPLDGVDAGTLLESVGLDHIPGVSLTGQPSPGGTGDTYQMTLSVVNARRKVKIDGVPLSIGAYRVP